MAIRALSGVIFTRGTRVGTATIRFHPHEAEIGAESTVEEMRDVGPDATFASVPCKQVALRQVTHLAHSSPLGATVTFAIDDEISAEALTVEWRTEGQGMLSEISYLVVGEVVAD